MGGLNFRVSLAPFALCGLEKDASPGLPRFPAIPGVFMFGALTLAAWLSPYSASVRGREDDTSSSVSHFASRSSVGTLPG